MSIEQANAFRTFVNENETVQEKIREGLVKDESFSLVELAAEHGYAFTREEAQTAWDEAQTGELSDFELEVVSGGWVSSRMPKHLVQNSRGAWVRREGPKEHRPQITSALGFLTGDPTPG